jgi:hypothetical protein
MRRVQRFLIVTMVTLGLLAPTMMPWAVYAHAEDSTSGSGSSSSGSGNSSNETETETETETNHGNANAKTKSAAAKAKLDATKLKVCQKREGQIDSIMTHIVTRADLQISVFDKIATRTEDFYKTKGKTVANYDQLVKAVDDAKKKAQDDLATIKADKVTFKCDGTDPKGASASFKDALKTEIADLKAYKTAVKNLIVGVKSVQSDADKTSTDKTESGDDTKTTTTTTGGTQ